MKRFLSLILVLVLLVPTMALPAQAVPYDRTAPDSDTAGKAYAAMMDDLAVQLLAYDGSNAESFTAVLEVPFDVPAQERFDFFDTLFLHTVREYPEIFWVNLGNRNHRYDESTKTVTYFVDIFPEFQGEKFARAQRAFTQALDSALEEMFHPGMSDMEKVLSAYGWIHQYVSYDLNTGWDAYSAYSVLVNRTAVCHGSAVAMNLFLREAGLDCCTVLSHVENEDMYHIWNAVQVEGTWYNLDPTASRTRGRHSYDKFMRSTEQMLGGGIYYEHVTRMHVECEQSYEGDTPWMDSNMPFLYSPERKALVNVANCMEQDGKIYLSDTAVYRTVTIDSRGNAKNTTLATLPYHVASCTQEYEDCLYYLTYEGQLRVHRISTGEDQLLSDKTYEKCSLYIEWETEELVMTDNDGNLRQTWPLDSF